MEMTGAQMVMESLVREGVEHIFGLPGGANLPLYDVIPQYYPKVRHYLVKHEQCAAHAADAYARVSGKAGVCFATSGPGATNLVTGIANAWMDSVPLVCITGQVIRALIGRDGFQEADITGITIPITKHNYLVMEAQEIPQVIREALHRHHGTPRAGPHRYSPRCPTAAGGVPVAGTAGAAGLPPAPLPGPGGGDEGRAAHPGVGAAGHHRRPRGAHRSGL